MPSSQIARTVGTYSTKSPALPSSGASSAITKFNMPITNVSASPVPLPLPREILPRERSVIDKMVEYLVGDGPSNRYALICKQCASHNGT